MTGLPSAFKVRNERTFGGKSSDCEEGQKFACAQPSGKHQEPLKGTCIPSAEMKSRQRLPVVFHMEKLVQIYLCPSQIPNPVPVVCL